MPYKNRETQLAYLRDYQRAKGRVFGRLKQLMGCARCGYRQNYAALELHHPEGKDKPFSSRWPWERILEELSRCEVLCSCCHRALHNPGAERPSGERPST